MTTYANSDPATDHLLNFIAGGVPSNEMGESGGNYDATFGDIDGSVYGVLADKSLTQIYVMQDEMLNNNGISTATGRYQALKSTLQAYQSGSGLSSTEMFTERLQDDFGLTKMVDRGYQSWWGKSINDDEFMHRLSCEWASLPDPYNGGKSHYDGDSAGNHASCTLADFRAAIGQARQYVEGDFNSGNFKPPRPEPPLVGVITDATQGIEAIQRTLVLTGDLSGRNDIDGIWGPASQGALDQLIRRS